MIEIKEIFTEEDHNIRTPDQTYDGSGDILKEWMGGDDLSQEAQLVREVLLSKLEKKELGMARVPVERICALLDPRRNDCSVEHLVNGNVHLKTSAINDLKNVASGGFLSRWGWWQRRGRRGRRGWRGRWRRRIHPARTQEAEGFIGLRREATQAPC